MSFIASLSSGVANRSCIEPLSDSESHETSGPSARCLAVLEGDFSGDDRAAIAVHPLDQAATTGRQVVDHLRFVQTDPLHIDQVEIGALARPDGAAVSEAVH